MEDIKAKKLEMTSSKELFSMRDNLMFYGLPKQENDKTVTRWWKKWYKVNLELKAITLCSTKFTERGLTKQENQDI